ncbi:hypothetical protein [Marinicella sp. W31]|uniref:hypothetical protein n=1 Tax=Marinicella sp. W31 TaxID=3023713 RepID=UPI003756FEDC
MKLKMLLVLFLTYPSIAAEYSPVTFQTLLSRLTNEQIEKIPELAYLAELKKEKDLGLQLSEDIDFLTQFGPEYLSMQLYTLYKLERQFGQNQLWVDLATQVFEVYGATPEGMTSHEQLWWMYFDLAKAYYKGPETQTKPAMAFKILAACAKEKDCNMLRERLLYYVHSADYLPDTRHLDSLWEAYTSDFQPMSQVEALHRLTNTEENTDAEITIKQPVDELFHQCQNILGSTDKVMLKFRKQQQNLLSQDSVTQNQLQEAYQSIASMNDLGNKQKITFKFDNINIQNVLSLSLGIMTQAKDQDDVLIKLPEDFPDYTVEIKAKDVPAVLAFSQIIDLFELEVLCHENWLLIQPKSAKSLNSSKKFLISNFITQYTFDAIKSAAVIEWGKEFKYEGEVKNQLPDGFGTLSTFGNKLNGQFKKGLLDGQGERASESGHITMKGQFKNGDLHGKGEYHSTGAYLSDKAHFSGNFKDGLFYGTGVLYLNKDPYAQYTDPEQKEEKLIQYTGPLSASQPSGEGRCKYQKMEYTCSFHQGYLIAFEGLSLLPVAK